MQTKLAGSAGASGDDQGVGDQGTGPGDWVLREGAATALNHGPDEQAVALDTIAAQPCGQRDSLTALKGGRWVGGRI